jgi:hypothetical protein
MCGRVTTKCSEVALRVGFGAWVLATLLSCGGQINPCGRTGICPKDAPPTQDQTESCEYSLDDPACGSKYQALINCGAAQEKCAPNGTEDLQASAAARISNCGSLSSTWLACVHAENADASYEVPPDASNVTD